MSSVEETSNELHRQLSVMPLRRHLSPDSHFEVSWWRTVVTRTQAFVRRSWLIFFLAGFATQIFADTRFESGVIYAGQPDGQAPTILGSDPVATCQTAISRTTYVPHTAQPSVVYYTSAVDGGFTARWYHCFGQYPGQGYDANGNVITITITGDVAWMYGVCPPTYMVGADSGGGYGVCKAHAYVSATPSTVGQCGSSCNGVGHPINPASGSVYDTLDDLPAADDRQIPFKRFYNSNDLQSLDLSAGWRHAYSRSINQRWKPLTYRQYVASDPNSSSLYGDEATACTSGFAQIKFRVSNWSNATASYANGVCTLSIGASTIGTLEIYADQDGIFHDNPSLLGFNVTRDDGQLIFFSSNGGSIVAPASISLTLQQTGSGYLVKDGEDNAENYGEDGRLISITSRSGVVETMGYDVSGRLNGVTDSLGHQLILSYDSQNRLLTVTRQ